jgi:hypothetical protein
MNRCLSLGVGCAFAAAAFAATALPARAANPPTVTITFKLTISGTVPAHDTFGVAQTVLLCQNPCLGGGHTYTATTQWLKDSGPVAFEFVRETRIDHQKPIHDQFFGQTTVNPTADRTVSAFFRYGVAAAVAVPSTGGAGAAGARTTTGEQAPPALRTTADKSRSASVLSTPASVGNATSSFGMLQLGLSGAVIAGCGGVALRLVRLRRRRRDTYPAPTLT